MAENLKKKRGSIKKRLTTLEKFVNSIKENSNFPSLEEVQLRYENNVELLKEFENIQSEIEQNCEEDELEIQEEERELFYDRYYSVIAYMKNFLSKTVNDNLENIQNAKDSLQNFLLPKIKLPTFSGEYEQWLEFKKNFISIIDQNKSLNNGQKYSFLKAALEGYAKRTISGCDESQDYQAAWQMLCKKFDKKVFLVETHIHSIFNVTPVSRGTFMQIRNLLDDISKHLSALEGMQLSKDSLWDMAIIHIVYNKLDKTSQNKWKEYYTSIELPSLEQFLEFLKTRTDILESMESTQSVKHENNQSLKYGKSSTRTHVNLTVTKNKCNCCKGDHTIYICPHFLKLNVNERWNKVNDLKLCANCLRSGHSKNTCYLSPCKKCKSKHNTLLHQELHTQLKNTSINPNPDQDFNSHGENNPPPEVTNVLVQTDTNAMSHQTYYSSTLLSTVTCKVKDSEGNFHSCRALLDSGAQSNLITEQFCKRLDLPLIPANLSIIGINQVTSTLSKRTTVTIQSNSKNFQCQLSCYVTPTITSLLPSEEVNTSCINIPVNLTLADPEFYLPHSIDMLIGVSLFWDLIIDGKITLGQNKPVLQNTKLGWIVSGTLTNSMSIQSSICNFSKVIPEDDQLKRFWELNEVDEYSLMSDDDLKCEEHFSKNTIRQDNGQFLVKFPFKHSPELLGESKEMAIRQFLSLEKGFKTNSDLYKLYNEFIEEYIQLGHMSKVHINQANQESNLKTYYLPHHGVMKDSSLTTKLRVVFNGSCPTTSGWSLNDLQHVGPKVQTNIFDILIRFRLYKYVVSADVSKMYRQILMHKDHRPLQRIIWRTNPNEELSIYELHTVTYGTTAAPYLAIKCMKQLATDYKTEFPSAANTILNDFYVDDLLTGSNNIDELQISCNEISSILKSANFILRKWVTNNPKVLDKLESCNISNETLNLGESESCKTLGVQWASHSDILKYKISSIIFNNTITKRKILSIISQIYDPLGLLSCVIITSKIIIQQLWSLKLPWDDPVPIDLVNKWNQFYNKLHYLNDLNIPRWAIGSDHALVDIHCFCDASSHAYASCIYLRSVNTQGNYKSYLLCSKTRVSPIKPITIPRLELCAALLGAQLIEQVLHAMSLTIPIYFWSDSKIVLCWIRKDPGQLQTFVANRVAKIQSLTNIHNWHYVNTSENPSDMATRGVSPEHLSTSKLWWHGPDFLSDSIDNFLNINSNLDIELPELKKTAILSVQTNDKFNFFNKFSSLTKLERVASYCQRFIFNIRNKPQNRIYGPLTALELNNAKTLLIKLSQSESFAEEIKLLQNKKSLKTKLASLCPFIDDQGILRVGGRLRFSHSDPQYKQPILLSSKHKLTTLIFRHKHAALLHPGPQLLLATIRQLYWAVGGRDLARKITKECIKCFKFNPNFATYPMSSLPENRVTPSLPFQTTGIDYAGPFLLKDKEGRGHKLLKCYVCVFICFVTKAIHLEVISDLTTIRFLSCLRRFTSRRGLPSDIYSDNGSTFVGANHELNELGKFLLDNQSTISNYANNDNIKWHFIPPYTPHFGGLWEAAVKSMKHHLKRMSFNKNFIYEDFNSLIVQIEGILNSRPLYALSTDPNDLEPLTPSHFLIGRPLTMPPDSDLTHVPSGRLPKLQVIQQMQQQFWIRFKKEYLSQLHSQYKWKDAASTIKIDALVLIKNDQQPSFKWPMGRIISLSAGRDGVSRVAEIKTHSKIIKRSVRHLCPLPMESDIYV